jgi:signal transduction histidine kinase
MGRLAGILYIASGAIALSSLPLVAEDAHVAGMVTVTLTAITIGCVCFVLPWDRWPRLASLALVPPAFALIAFYNLYQGAGLYTYGIFFVITFVWIGVAHARGTSLAMAPLATIAYVVPVYFLPGDVAMGITSAIVTIPACVMVGETLAWGAERLAQAEEALHRERELAEKLKELDDLKTTFLATISHELRTPIAICRGHLEVLDPASGAGEIGATTDLVLDELDRMSRLVDDVTTMVRGDDPSFLHKEPVPVDDLARRVARKVSPFLNGRLRMPQAPPAGSVEADPLRLQQALVNLLHNAAVHTSEDEPVEFHVADGGAWWKFSILDRGPGLVPGEEERAFEGFVRGEGSRGSGLGLAVVRSIARAHGGEAGVDNHPGEGATFWILIPN